jgi:heme exporter protein A
MPAALDLHGIAKLYGRTAALKAISLHLESGQVLALLGPNGSGKTTLLKILAGAITPTLGQGTIFDHDIRTHRVALRSQVGLLAAETYLYDDLTAKENLRFITVMAGTRLDDGVLLQALEDVSLDRHARDRVRSFSSGMKRRLAIARLLLLRPRLLLLDEPYNSLDASAAELVDALIRSAAAEGRTVALATHDAPRALGLADQVAVLQRGALVHLGPAHAYQGDAQHVG